MACHMAVGAASGERLCAKTVLAISSANVTFNSTTPCQRQTTSLSGSRSRAREPKRPWYRGRPPSWILPATATASKELRMSTAGGGGGPLMLLLQQRTASKMIGGSCISILSLTAWTFLSPSQWHDRRSVIRCQRVVCVDPRDPQSHPKAAPPRDDGRVALPVNYTASGA